MHADGDAENLKPEVVLSCRGFAEHFSFQSDFLGKSAAQDLL
jgi:hypothetical protein